MDWNTRLEVSVGGTPLCPIDSFQPTFATPATAIHSIEGENVGVSFGPRTATFTMALKAIGAPTAMLTRMALDRTRFEITISEATGTDWSFTKLLFENCIITSAQPSNVMIDGAPAATFSGIILTFADGVEE